jgi:hypothetical protein
VPAGVVHMVFHYFHSTPTWGHLGMLKTIQKIRHLTWKGMDADICNRASFGFVASQPTQRPLQGLLIDYVGKFSRSKTGNSLLKYAFLCSLNLFGFF